MVCIIIETFQFRGFRVHSRQVQAARASRNLLDASTILRKGNTRVRRVHASTFRSVPLPQSALCCRVVRSRDAPYILTPALWAEQLLQF